MAEFTPAFPRAPRFVSFDADVETVDIHKRVEKVMPAELRRSHSLRCTTTKQFKAALAQPSSVLIVMGHGFKYPFHGSDGMVSDNRPGRPRRAVVSQAAPVTLDCDALVLLICYQRNPTEWRARLLDHAVLASSPEMVSTGAIKHFAPALIENDATTAQKIDEIRLEVGARCSTLLTRPWRIE